MKLFPRSNVIWPMFPERPRNRLLSILPAEEWKEHAPNFERITLAAGNVLIDDGEAFQKIYFPSDCVISCLAVFESGVSVEMATIGREGAAPVAGLFGRRMSLAQQTVQIPGSALAISHKAFSRLRQESVPFDIILDAYVEAFIGQLLNSVACNAVHKLEQRAARWLLMCQDSVETETFPLTQEYFAALLGTERPTINVVSRRMREIGAISYGRGKIRVLDRSKLEKLACECYNSISSYYNDVFSLAATAIANYSKSKAVSA